MGVSGDALGVLQAVVALGLLTFLMFLWMYATRLPAFTRAGVQPQDAMHPGTYADRLPSEVRRVADNYNHLFEAPTLFYAVALAVVVAGVADGVHLAAAWAFVGLRAVHSIVQATANIVVIRFAVFSLSWAALATMLARLAIQLF
ncbi:MAG: MAPEG family protein [Thermaurantiacus sp.]